MNVLHLSNPVLARTARRAAQAGTIVLLFYLTFIGGFVLGVREYKWWVITLGILGLLWGSWFLYKFLRHTNPPVTGLEYPLLLMLGVTTLATIFSTDPRLSAGRASLNVILAISLYFTIDWLSDRWRAKLLVNAMLLAGGVVCLIGLVEYWQWYAGYWNLPVSWRGAGVDWNFDMPLRIKSILHNPNYLAYYLILILGLSFYKLFKATALWQRAVWGGYLLLVIITIVLTESRGGLLGAFVTTFVAFIFFLWPRLSSISLVGRLKRPRQILLIGASLMLMLLLLFPVVTRLDFDDPRLLSLRDDIWQGALGIFLAHPILGAGAGTFPAQYMIYRNQAGHTAIFTHGHNVWLTIAAEYGIVGVISVLAFFIILSAMILSYLRRTRPQQWSGMMLTGVSILAGQGIHNLVDDFMEFPIFTWFTILAIAFCILPIQAQRPPLSRQRRRLWLLLVGIGLLIIIGGSLRSGRAFAAYDRARIASYDGDWPQTTYWLEKAVELDPAYRFYRQQLALAYGEMARTDDKYLSLALTQQEQVYTRGHHYSPDAAYLACLSWQSGQPDRAIALMRVAISTTPSGSGGFYSYHLGQETFYFNLGYYLESIGEIDLARQAYQRVLQGRPELVTSTYWQVNDNRRQMLRTLANTYRVDDDYAAIVELLTIGDLAQAEAKIKQAFARSFLEQEPPYYYLWGKLVELQGDTLSAGQHYKQAIAASTAIRTDYANLVGQRQPLATEQPFCLMIPYPAEYLSQPSLALARLRLADDDSAGAVEVYQNLLKHEPYNLEARQRLAGVLEDDPG